MPEFPRREFLAGAAALAARGASFSVPSAVLGGDMSFSNNLPDPLLSGKELPTFVEDGHQAHPAANSRFQSRLRISHTRPRCARLGGGPRAVSMELQR
jgi:hypothetical protein